MVSSLLFRGKKNTGFKPKKSKQKRSIGIKFKIEFEKQEIVEELLLNFKKIEKTISKLKKMFTNQ